MKPISRRRALSRLSVCSVAALGATTLPAFAQAQPLRIGMSMSLTGGLSSNGKPALIAMQMWEEDTNAKGGLLGRPVKLVYYDDQSQGASIPGIYTKLLDVDKVDFVVSGYSTAAVVPALPIVIQRKMVFLGLLAFGANSHFNYDRYFSMVPAGGEAPGLLSKGYFEIAKSITPKPRRVAIASLDAEFAKRSADGAEENAKAAGMEVVYNRSYPPTTVDFVPIVRAIAAAKPDVVFIASYPVDSAGMIRAIREVGLNAALVGGSPIGPQTGGFKQQMGTALNNLVTWDIYAPEKTMDFPGIRDFLVRYQAVAVKQGGVDPLGLYVPPLAYAEMQVLGQAIAKAGKVDQGAVADVMRSSTFPTIYGDVKFGFHGEWAEERNLFVQYRNVTSGDLDQFRKPGTQVILYPPKYKSGDLVTPFASK